MRTTAIALSLGLGLGLCSLPSFAASLAEQSAASEDIARHVEKIASMSNENNAAVQSSDQAIEQLAQDAGQLGRQVAEFQV